MQIKRDHSALESDQKEIECTVKKKPRWDDVALEINNTRDDSSNSDSDSDNDSESDSEEEKDFSVHTYLDKKEKQFIPYEEDDSELQSVINRKYLFFNHDDARKWHCSNSHGGLMLLNAHHRKLLEETAPFDDKQFWIESAVVGGRIYRLILGAPQPNMYAVEGDPTSMNYRLSKDIPNFFEWTRVLQKNMLHRRPIIGLTAIHLVASFLADIDMNDENFGVSKTDKALHAVKIDPECCFSYPFYTEKYSNILNGLTDFESEVPKNLFNKKEFFETLATIISTPVESYKEIIDSSFSACYARQKKIYVDILSNRINLFQQAAFALDGFEQFYSEYQEKRRLEAAQREAARQEQILREQEQLRLYQQFEQDYPVYSSNQESNQQKLEELSEFGLSGNMTANPNSFFDYRQDQQVGVAPSQVFSLIASN
ncbi:hypothetical protein [Legionella maioricensis]|uniref:Uncharacterized protein n=1 Tax=Legionella maioricensis TaxID=2896528 RepID=A0A9X2I8U1_9GAMM|nr:hypothetical protein [Legionella maioricensis]MCL9682969.1 hypothetical protein [Legionella maioricensis]MCL9686317.1 hypothetical protein [Legionella maioricensis]